MATDLPPRKKIKMTRSALVPTYDKGSSGVPLVIPKVWPVGLTFLRNCFNRLREFEAEREDLDVPEDIDFVATDSAGPKKDDPTVSITFFHRVMVRLLRIQNRDISTFQASDYDFEGNNRITFSGFAECWRDLKLQTTFSPFERIYITFDASGASSSKAGRLVSSVIMLCILVSSTSFILSTLQGELWQYHPCPGCKPKPKPVFAQIEEGCLVVFTAEFLLRLITSHAIRTQLLKEDSFVDTLCGDEQVVWASPLGRTWAFCKEPTNIIDFLAIAPYYLEKAVDTNTNLMVLRLVRLTRMFRILRLGKLSDAMDTLVTTFELSLPSLYVLGFYICLGILVSSSIVYYAEAGEWDPHDGVYKVMNPLTKEMQETLFVSIPDAFWWNIVTVTTVGYGDLYPTTPMGKFFGSITIVAGVIAFAMPVGVISSNFSRVWDAAEKEKKNSNTHSMTIGETESRTIGIGFEHTGCSRSIVKIEVWDDDGYGAEPGFLGEATVDIARMGWNPNVASGASLKLRLETNMAQTKSKQSTKLSGSVHVNLLYEPDDVSKKNANCSPKERLQKFGQLETQKNAQVDRKNIPFTQVIQEFWKRPETPELKGTITVHVVSGKGLTNLNAKLRGISDPFCRVTVYPSLKRGSKPHHWQTAVVYNCLSPEWNEAQSVNVDWASTKPERSSRKEGSISEAPASHQAWESSARHSAVVSAAATRSISKERLSHIPRDDVPEGEGGTSTPPAPLDLSNLMPNDPEYVVKRMIDELQREVDFWKAKRETQQRQHEEHQRQQEMHCMTPTPSD
eukprot:gnl/MRDRNA2_/MRDRNA2_59277_c0_seq1.p1 gnl/MRDRNA2_/MRDRNA2_59277_c0~~gnl/MRDRNA2_/MRDRNA2_59277_c0_seq1.p1  ORF type:complete len:815 (-),score=124.35 gnl/MRDRNA2_/MRDRNA2_59277_c0_seq1:9-2384(-)